VTQAPSIVSRLRSGIALNVVGNIFAQGSTFALNLIAANLLGRYAFGEFTTVQATLSTVAALGQGAIGYTVTKHVAEFREHDPDKAGRILRLCAIVSTATALLAALALAVTAGPIADRLLAAPPLAGPLRLVAVAVFFLVMNGYRIGALAGLESYPALARAGIASGLVYLLAGAAGAMAGGVYGALAGVTVGVATQWAILGHMLKAELARWHISHVPDPWRERSALLRFAVPASITGFISLPAFWFASALLIRQPGGLDQMALYAAANSFRVIVMFLPSAMTSVGTSLLNNQRWSSADSYRRLFWWNLGLTAGCSVGAAVLIVAAGPWVFRAFGRGFASASGVLPVIMVAAVAEALAAATYQVIQTHGKMWFTLFLITLPRDAAIVALAYALTPVYGATGLAAAHAIGWTLALVVIGVLTYRLGFGAGPTLEAAPALLSSDI
jgi:O-antigen/teichoic acid export membrane protein